MNKSSRWRGIIIFLAAVSVFARPHDSYPETLVIKAEGKSEKADSEPETKKRAVDEALKNAVLSAASLFAEKDGNRGVLDIFQKDVGEDVSRYVMNYKITSGGWVTHFENTAAPETSLEPAPEAAPSPAGVDYYHVWIEANIDGEGLKNEIFRLLPTAGPENAVTVILLNVADYRTFEELKNAIAGVGIVKELSYDSFSRGRIALNAVTLGNADALYERLSKKLGKDFILTVEAENRIVIRKEEGE